MKLEALNILAFTMHFSFSLFSKIVWALWKGGTGALCFSSLKVLFSCLQLSFLSLCLLFVLTFSYSFPITYSICNYFSVGLYACECILAFHCSIQLNHMWSLPPSMGPSMKSGQSLGSNILRGIFSQMVRTSVLSVTFNA